MLKDLLASKGDKIKENFSTNKVKDSDINDRIGTVKLKNTAEPDSDSVEQDKFELEPIGLIESWYKNKNGTPRQPTICQKSKGCILI